MSRFINLSQVWCIEPRAARFYLKVYSDIQARKAESEPNAKAFDYDDESPALDSLEAQTKSGVAVISLRGPIIKHSTLLSDISGTATVEGLRAQFSQAMSSRDVKGIVFDINSPGGEANGIRDFAAQIYESRGKGKPIVAFADGAMASAAYWIGAACDEVVLSETAHPVGSIGAMVAFLDDSKQLEMMGLEEIEFISSQSPMKCADPKTDDGKAQYQGMVDDMAAVFISEVARFRGVTTEKVESDFGKGGVFVGQKAVDAGLADRIGTLDSVIQNISQGTRKNASTRSSNKKPTVAARATNGGKSMGLLESIAAKLGISDEETVEAAETTAPVTQAAQPATIDGMTAEDVRAMKARLDALEPTAEALKAQAAENFAAKFENRFLDNGAGDEPGCRAKARAAMISMHQAGLAEPLEELLSAMPPIAATTATIPATQLEGTRVLSTEDGSDKELDEDVESAKAFAERQNKAGK